MLPRPACGQSPQDQGTTAPLAPIDAVATFRVTDGFRWDLVVAEPTISQPVMVTFDLRGQIWVVEYHQYPEPAGITAISHDTYWRTVYDKKPLPPPQGIAGKDRLSVYAYHNQSLSQRGVFVDGLNIATAVAPDHSGVWVLTPPYLLYYADEDQDLHPDSDPVVHLDGFGLEDTHSVVNSLCFGPDGWLYAAQGSTVSGNVRSNLQTDAPQKSMGQLIWRYHPQLHTYEIFAEGGGNAFGVAFDNEGRIFSGHNGGDTRGFYYEQGGYYRKGFTKHGELSNPFAFGYLEPMQHDPIQRFTHTMLLTHGTCFETAMPESMLTVDPLHGKLFQTALMAKGSTYRTQDTSVACETTDKWFRPVAITDGPDGAAYIADWYDSQVAHIYAHEGRIDRDHGRVYRFGDQCSNTQDWSEGLADSDDTASLQTLVSKLEHPYRWQRWNARRLIARHPKREEVYEQISKSAASNSMYALDAFWTMHACGLLQDCIEPVTQQAVPVADFFQHELPAIRRWAVRLACDDRNLTTYSETKLIDMIAQEHDAQNLVQLAASIRRLPDEQALRLAARLVQRVNQSSDPVLPLMIWWMIEAHADQHEHLRKHIVENAIARETELYCALIAPNLLQRALMRSSDEDFQTATQVLDSLRKVPPQFAVPASKAAIAAFEATFQRKPLTGLPSDLLDALIVLGEPPLTLKLRAQDPAAVQEAIAAIESAATPLEIRLQLVRIFGETPNSSALPVIHTLSLQVNAPESIRVAAIQAASSYESLKLSPELIAAWSQLRNDLRIAASAYMAARAESTRELLIAVDHNLIAKQDIPLEVLRSMRNHDDTWIQQTLDKLFPATASMNLTLAKVASQRLIADINTERGDPYAGKKVFQAACGRCHRLFDSGGDIGPDLTGYQRDQTEQLILNIIAPSLEIREGYQALAVLDEDGVIRTGFIERQSEQSLTIRAVDGQSHVIPKESIDEMRTLPNSLMPDGILDTLNLQQIRDLFAYLRSSQPLNN